jgi:hypothetical protein
VATHIERAADGDVVVGDECDGTPVHADLSGDVEDNIRRDRDGLVSDDTNARGSWLDNEPSRARKVKVRIERARRGDNQIEGCSWGLADVRQVLGLEVLAVRSRRTGTTEGARRELITIP